MNTEPADYKELEPYSEEDLKLAYEALTNVELANDLFDTHPGLVIFLINTPMMDILIHYFETKNCFEGFQIEEAPEPEKKTYPKLTREDIIGVIKDEYYHHVPETSMTICVLTLKNDFQVTGESASASVENFDSEVGRTLAKSRAVEQIWKLEGYLLKEKMYWEEILKNQNI